ncbi:PTS sugar transporter subunit IIB [Salibacterium halotolerans]|uniref:PTS system, ascorbate-specific IIB component n=1 Tax=Salibacterium halotolerans TaxID=1884432 RepID=A0A1I5L8E1_9BACI|nr:PTS sugar transporter subunit IIB [Salibacterium halotolerans]SFO93550.1 PTS system, ascorbate-specific IIB component [Salibacterium halotolerans]
MKFLAVCGFGVGSSMVLKLSIEKACKDRNIGCEVENTDLSSAKGANVDAVFTSHELAEELENSMKCPVFPIKRYMDKEEVGQSLDQLLENRGN